MMVKKSEKNNSLKKILIPTVLAAFFLVFGILGLSLGGITGLITYKPVQAEWFFDEPYEYEYDSSLIEVFGNAKLRLQTDSLKWIFQEEGRYDYDPNLIEISNNEAMLKKNITSESITFKNGERGYNGEEDALISQKNPSFIYPSDKENIVRSTDNGKDTRMLIKFDDLPIPEGATLSSAKLFLRIRGHKDGDGAISLYALKKQWHAGSGENMVDRVGEYGTTWNNSEDYYEEEGADVSWELAGVNGASDRELNYIDSKKIPNGASWIEFDVTAHAKDWVNRDNNYGVILMGNNNGADKVFGMTSKISDRPYLVIEYKTTNYDDSVPYIVPKEINLVDNIRRFESFEAIEDKEEDSEIYYQLSDDGIVWRYWDGSSWVAAFGEFQYNIKDDVNQNVGLFPTANKRIVFKAFLESDGKTNVKLSSVEIKYSYYSPASIETKDFNLGSSLDNVILTSIAEGDIIYEYSIDSGKSWKSVPSDGGIDLNSKMIRIKSTLRSDGSTTPTLEKLVLSYSTCIEEWSCTEWPECDDATQTRTCKDFNNCGTVLSKPIETKYCIPVKYSITGTDLVSISKNKTTSIESDELSLDLMVKEDIIDKAITIRGNIDLSDKPLPSGKVDLNKSREIVVDNDINSNLIDGLIKIYYTDEELIGLGLDELSLAIYYYNEDSKIWERLNSSVNTTGNYVSASVNHFSIYTLIGDRLKNGSPVKESSGSTSGTGGGGGSSNRGSSSPEDAKINERIDSDKIVIEEQRESVDGNDVAPPSSSFGNNADRTGLLTGLFTADSIILKFAKQNWIIGIVFALVLGLLALFLFKLRKRNSKKIKK